MKFYFVVNEGGEASNIRMKFEGADVVNVSANGGLIIHTAIGDKVFEKAHIARFNAAGNIVPMPASGKSVVSIVPRSAFFLKGKT